MRTALLISFFVTLLAGAMAAQRGGISPASSLPPVSMTCPMHPDVIDTRQGNCPLCRMALVPVRLDSAWMCPVHAVVVDGKPGSCRICRRQLIQVTVALTFTCRGDAVEHLEPGLCSDGSPRIGKRTLRPHGNHNAQHGGQFFMAPDNWHHLEGTYPRDRVFRLYLYDDYARPLPPNQMKRLQARVVTQETFDSTTRVTKELKTFPLRASRDGAYLEARIDATSLPAEMTAKVRLKNDAPEYRFDFTFPALTKDPNAPPPAPAARRPSPATVPVAVLPTLDPVAPSPDPGLVELPVPETLPEILAQLQARNMQIGDLIQRGDFGAVWVPAFRAKDLAVALEPHLDHLPVAGRLTGESALGEVVRLAWLLDALGDTGNRQQLTDAYKVFAATVSTVVTAFGEAR